MTTGTLASCGLAEIPSQSATVPQAAAPTPNPTFTPDVEITLTATTGVVEIFPGTPTKVWRYEAALTQGASTVVTPMPNSYLGPIIRVHRGQKVRIHLKNDLPEATIIHWHGLIVPSAMDGHPDQVIDSGATYVYEFEVKNRAGSYWFHPHPHGRTGPQVYNGLAGLFLVSDDEEQALDLPRGAYDMPLVIQDRTFDEENQLVYMASGMDGMMDQMMGFLGDQILVNGQPDATVSVATRAYRLRLYNGSNSRVYKLAWSNGMPMTVIATDGGLLEKPVQRAYVTLGTAERVDLWADFSNEAVGSSLTLQSLAFSGVEAGMMGDMSTDMMGHNMMGMEAALPNGAPFDLLTVQVVRSEQETLTLPTELATMTRHQQRDAVNSNQPRQFILAMDNSMAWTINGRTFAMNEVAEEEKVRFGDLEVWEFINTMDGMAMDGESGSMMGGMMNHGDQANQQGMMGGGMRDFMAHPMHIHGVQFQIVERQIDAEQRAGWETLQAGFVDEGWKDTVLVMPGERVRVLVRFDEYPGMYLYHCHNLEHEDQGMMRNFEII